MSLWLRAQLEVRVLAARLHSVKKLAARSASGRPYSFVRATKERGGLKLNPIPFFELLLCMAGLRKGMCYLA